jgi:hypothetical protein
VAVNGKAVLDVLFGWRLILIACAGHASAKFKILTLGSLER